MNKEVIFTTTGIIGAFIAQLFGGWTQGMTTLVILMIIDYIMGILVAAVFGTSKKTEDGKLESRAGWKGLVRKGVTLLIVLVATRIDMLMETTFVRDAAVIGFSANELLSIVENAGLMGIPMPKVITDAVEVLQNRSEEEH
jgi:toxin secretion/phage lysis holin